MPTKDQIQGIVGARHRRPARRQRQVADGLRRSPGIVDLVLALLYAAASQEWNISGVYCGLISLDHALLDRGGRVRRSRYFACPVSVRGGGNVLELCAWTWRERSRGTGSARRARSASAPWPPSSACSKRRPTPCRGCRRVTLEGFRAAYKGADLDAEPVVLEVAFPVGDDRREVGEAQRCRPDCQTLHLQLIGCPGIGERPP